MTLTTMEHQTGADPQATVIWMHGLGADAHDFEPVVPALDLGPERPVRYVFPNAPLRPVTINGGMVMRAWYDVLGFGPESPEDQAGIRDSAAEIGGLIEREEKRGIPPERVVIAGFSQGGATALYTALRYPQRLAGILALSAYLPMSGSLSAESHPANRQSPIFMAHGEADHVLPIWIGRHAYEKLLALNYEVSWKSYPMMHGVIPEELEDVREFLSRVL